MRAVKEIAPVADPAKVVFIKDGQKPVANWRNLAGGQGVCLSYLYDYLQYQAPLTTQTLASGVELSVTDVLPEHATAIQPQEFLRDVDTEIAGLPRSTWFHLSAGLDSSFLFLRAAQLRGSAHAATFRARGKGADGELDIAQRIADHAKQDLTVFDFTDIDILQSGREMVAACPVYPIAHPSHLVRFLLDRALKQEKAATHIVSGRGMDECIGGYPWHGDDFQDGVKHHGRVQSTSAAFLDTLFGGRLGQAEGNYRTFFKDGHGFDLRLRYDLASLHQAWLVLEQGFEQGFDIKYVLPFSNPALMGRLLALPLAQRKNKEFLRKNFMDIYPEFVLNVPKMGLTFDMRAYLKQYTHADLMKNIFDKHDMCQKHLRRDVFSNMLEETLGDKENYGWQVWGIYLSACVVESAGLVP